ncbi:putative nuclease S1-1 [Coleophoma cylindrospora]|uniref:Putative nuclease S1-1 n=1 Tax=Coleophoma cylindrospora TaxID=1849047 RepID=A0A3D8SEP3_9HELO|nr:putative nuclease S1-1 [Coleophoma cylindrospora]
MKFQASLSLAILAAIPRAFAWGTLGHDTVAYIASNFVTAETATYFQNILGDTSANYLASVATWADSYRYTTAGTFSAPYHYIDANDSPPTTCDVVYSRDCGSTGCVVSAIKNYTSRVQSSSVSAAEKLIATKFLVHSPVSQCHHGQKYASGTDASVCVQFLGDIHQPLHDEELEVGGNGITVTFNGKSTNLHHIWDTEIPEKYVGGYALTDAKSWATTLTTAIKTGTYKSSAASWLKGMDITDAQASALVWASDANSYVCSTVLVDGVSAVEGVDLAGAYYTAALPIVKLQIAKSGYRLAAWLNLIATGSTGL